MQDLCHTSFRQLQLNSALSINGSGCKPAFSELIDNCFTGSFQLLECLETLDCCVVHLDIRLLCSSSRHQLWCKFIQILECGCLIKVSVLVVSLVCFTDEYYTVVPYVVTMTFSYASPHSDYDDYCFKQSFISYDIVISCLQYI